MSYASPNSLARAFHRPDRILLSRCSHLLDVPFPPYHLRYVLLWYNHEDHVPTSNFAQATTGSSSPTPLLVRTRALHPQSLTLTLALTLTRTSGCVWRSFPGHASTKYTATMQIKSSDKVFLRAIERPSGGVAAPTTCSATGEDAPCFPSSATVVLASGAKRSLNTLQLGDEIVVATAAGVLTTDTVSALTLADNNAVSTFLVLSTATGHNVTLTEGHHVPVGPSCCATLKTASEMKLGDTMWIVSTTGAAIPAAVTKIAQVSKMGLHSPVMTHGSFPLVDGVVTAFDSIHMVTAAGYFLPMLETTGTIELFKSVALHRERKYI